MFKIKKIFISVVKEDVRTFSNFHLIVTRFKKTLHYLNCTSNNTNSRTSRRIYNLQQAVRNKRRSRFDRSNKFELKFAFDFDGCRV